MINIDERVFAALADPTRRQLLTTLAENSPKTATQLAQEIQVHHQITRQGILKHLNLLADAGLVRAQPKGREKRYSLTPEPLDNISAWIDALGKKWDERLSRLKNLVESDETL
jgi:DNA-binding transcriptional ArsR family regulator